MMPPRSEPTSRSERFGPFGLRMGAMIVAALQEDWRQVSEIAKSTKLAMANGEPIPAEFKELLDSEKALPSDRGSEGDTMTGNERGAPMEQRERPTIMEAPCETCNDDPQVCATVPGLRHCEAAAQEYARSQSDKADYFEQRMNAASKVWGNFGEPWVPIFLVKDMVKRIRELETASAVRLEITDQEIRGIARAEYVRVDENQNLVHRMTEDVAVATVREVLRRFTPSAVTLPTGWKLVPVQLTTEMYDAFASVNCRRNDVDERITFQGDFGNFVACYWAMLNAAPQPPIASAMRHKTPCGVCHGTGREMGDAPGLVVSCRGPCLGAGYVDSSTERRSPGCWPLTWPA